MYKSKKPKLTDLELTNNCNLACPICTENNRKKWEIDLFELEKILKVNIDILKWTTIWLHFRWEPLLYKNLFTAIDLLDKYWIKWSFSTNWILLTDFNIEKIINSKISRIVVSAITNSESDYIHLRWKNFLKLVEKNILNLKNTLDKNNSQIKLQVMGLNYWQWKKKIDAFIKKYNDLNIDVSIHNYSTRTGETKTVYNKNEVFQKIERKPCYWLFRKIWILWDGTIAPCCYDMEWKIFWNLNIKDFDYDILKVWNSEEYNKIRNDHNNWIYKWNCEKCIDWKYEHPDLPKSENNWIELYKV